jgi:hypothetical protein
MSDYVYGEVTFSDGTTNDAFWVKQWHCRKDGVVDLIITHGEYFENVDGMPCYRIIKENVNPFLEELKEAVLEASQPQIRRLSVMCEDLKRFRKYPLDTGIELLNSLTDFSLEEAEDENNEISSHYFYFFDGIKGKTVESLEFSSEGYCFNKEEE